MRFSMSINKLITVNTASACLGRAVKSSSAVLLAMFALSWSAAGFAAITPLEPDGNHKTAIKDMVRQLEARHYVKLDIDDAMSQQLLDAYLLDLDGNKQLFLQSDIDEYHRLYDDKLDDQLKKAKLEAGYRIFNDYREKLVHRLEVTIDKLSSWVEAMDFSTDESIVIDRRELAWPKSQQEADEIWRKQLKNRVLSLKLAGKEDADIVELLQKRYRNQLRRIEQLEDEDAFQIYANAFASLYDPHTDYFSPRTSENFQINMSLKLEGIGAVLQLEDDYTKVVRLVPAGPADKQGQLQPADRIVGVAQGESGEMTDVIGLRLDDVVDMIRGPAGSIVRLEVIPAVAHSDEERQEIVIERNEVKLEEQSAQGELIEVTDAQGETRKVGVIDIPTFYMDFEAFRAGDANYRSTTRDVHRILGELLSEGAEGIVIDLRDNGGGSLVEANGLVGLFIKSGPTVQIRQANSRVGLEGKRRSSPYYTGPLAVMINRMSASASEIFAGAIQDYKRGLVVGTQSFGKGTVQSVNPLRYGQLKLTESKFYRVSGDSTQNRGVIPDIEFPPIYDKDEIGEGVLDNAMSWDRIPQAPHSYYFDLDDGMAKLRKRHDQRIAEDPDFRFLEEQLAAIEKLRDRRTLSLNLEMRRREREEQKALQLAMENRRRVAKGEEPLASLDEDDKAKAEDDSGDSTEVVDELPLTPDSVADTVPGETDEGDEDKPDPMLKEAAHILVDAIPFFQTERLAAQP